MADRNHGTKWIPESPTVGALYAPKDYEVGYKTATFDVYHSMQFETQAECQKWCDNNPKPKFVPVEHMFIDHVCN